MTLLERAADIIKNINNPDINENDFWAVIREWQKDYEEKLPEGYEECQECGEPTWNIERTQCEDCGFID